MTIPHLDERRKLLALLEQEAALEREEEDALAQPKAALEEAEKRADADEEYRAAGGIGLRGLDASRLGQLAAARNARLEPARAAFEAAQEPFEMRRDALRDEISAIKKAIGSELAENYWTGEGGTVLCAITGLPILNSDKIAVVLAAALPAKAG